MKTTLFGLRKYIPTAIFSFLVIGGFGKENVVFMLLVLLAVSLCLISDYIQKTLSIPKHFYLYVALMVVFFVNLFLSTDPYVSFQIYLMFLVGGLLWLYFSCNRNTEHYLGKSVLFLSFIFTGVFLYHRFVSLENPIGYNLYWYPSIAKSHIQFGILWALSLVYIVYLLFFSEKKVNKLLIFILGILASFCVFVSFSRSAMITLFVGSLSLFYFKKGYFNFSLKILIALFVLISLFLIIGSQKTLFGSRDYWFQGLVGLTKYPFGVGVGNFGVISDDPRTHILGLDGFSNTAHNIILEFFGGMGFLGIIFFIWLALILKTLFKIKGKSLLAKSIFMALFVNFLLDFNYFIPTTLWLWFISLGLITSKYDSKI